jgi:hypothetical protein
MGDALRFRLARPRPFGNDRVREKSMKLDHQVFRKFVQIQGGKKF